MAAPEGHARGCRTLIPEDWDGVIHRWTARPFFRERYRAFLFVPVGFDGIIEANLAKLEALGALDRFSIYPTRAKSPFRGDLLISLDPSKAADFGANVERLTGHYLSKMWRASYKDIGRAIQYTRRHARHLHGEAGETLSWIATCRECTKREGKFDLVVFTKVPDAAGSPS